MKKLIIGLMAVGLVGMMVLPAMAATTDTANVSLLITPVVRVVLSVSPTYYNFGFVDVKTSTASVTALTLTNWGEVGITIDKTVWDDAEWRIDYSSTAQDGFNLWAMTRPSQPGVGDYDNANYEFSASSKNAGFTDLYCGNPVEDEDLDPKESANLWFRLDMPVSVTNTNLQTIHVRLRGFAK